MVALIFVALLLSLLFGVNGNGNNKVVIIGKQGKFQFLQSLKLSKEKKCPETYI